MSEYPVTKRPRTMYDSADEFELDKPTLKTSQPATSTLSSMTRPSENDSDEGSGDEDWSKIEPPPVVHLTAPTTKKSMYDSDDDGASPGWARAPTAPPASVAPVPAAKKSMYDSDDDGASPGWARAPTAPPASVAPVPAAKKSMYDSDDDGASPGWARAPTAPPASVAPVPAAKKSMYDSDDDGASPGWARTDVAHRTPEYGFSGEVTPKMSGTPDSNYMEATPQGSPSFAFSQSPPQYVQAGKSQPTSPHSGIPGVVESSILKQEPPITPSSVKSAVIVDKEKLLDRLKERDAVLEPTISETVEQLTRVHDVESSDIINSLTSSYHGYPKLVDILLDTLHFAQALRDSPETTGINSSRETGNSGQSFESWKEDKLMGCMSNLLVSRFVKKTADQLLTHRTDEPWLRLLCSDPAMSSAFESLYATLPSSTFLSECHRQIASRMTLPPTKSTLGQQRDIEALVSSQWALISLLRYALQLENTLDSSSTSRSAELSAVHEWEAALRDEEVLRNTASLEEGKEAGTADEIALQTAVERSESCRNKAIAVCREYDDLSNVCKDDTSVEINTTRKLFSVLDRLAVASFTVREAILRDITGWKALSTMPLSSFLSTELTKESFSLKPSTAIRWRQVRLANLVERVIERLGTPGSETSSPSSLSVNTSDSNPGAQNSNGNGSSVCSSGSSDIDTETVATYTIKGSGTGAALLQILLTQSVDAGSLRSLKVAADSFLLAATSQSPPKSASARISNDIIGPIVHPRLLGPLFHEFCRTESTTRSSVPTASNPTSVSFPITPSTSILPTSGVSAMGGEMWLFMSLLYWEQDLLYTLAVAGITSSPDWEIPRTMAGWSRYLTTLPSSIDTTESSTSMLHGPQLLSASLMTAGIQMRRICELCETVFTSVYGGSSREAVDELISIISPKTTDATSTPGTSAPAPHTAPTTPLLAPASPGGQLATTPRTPALSSSPLVSNPTVSLPLVLSINLQNPCPTALATGSTSCGSSPSAALLTLRWLRVAMTSERAAAMRANTQFGVMVAHWAPLFDVIARQFSSLSTELIDTLKVFLAAVTGVVDTSSRSAETLLVQNNTTATRELALAFVPTLLQYSVSEDAFSFAHSMLASCDVETAREFLRVLLAQLTESIWTSRPILFVELFSIPQCLQAVTSKYFPREGIDRLRELLDSTNSSSWNRADSTAFTTLYAQIRTSEAGI